MWSILTIASVILLAGSGVPGAFAGARLLGAQKVAAAMVVGGAVLGLAVAVASLGFGANLTIVLPGPMPDMALHFHIDPLGAFFLAPICLIGALGAIYGLGYWRQGQHRRTGQRLRFLYGLLIASMAGVVLAADSIAFLISWEVMALSAFFLIVTDEQNKETREAGWLYLVCTHVSTLALFALFALLRMVCGTFDFRLIEPGQSSLGLRMAIFLLALFGFGLKAGMMPLHFWLPGAHANAPSHVSAILSGVLLKMGIYGLLRTLTLLPIGPAAWGGLVLLLGTLSAVLGVLFAVGQHDLKRLLAYHSIENIGIILMGLGLAMIGQSRGQSEWVVLGLGGCLLHVWNHGLFKSLLFLGAGSVVHAVHTREIDRMGGLAKTMPATAVLFFVGATAICGLPPLNGFFSELLIYLGLFHNLSGAALAAPCLALVGALAVACFVKAYGAVFLGQPRTSRAERGHESPYSMIFPMAALAVCCAIIGIFPGSVVGAINRVVASWPTMGSHPPAVQSLVPVALLTWMNVPLAVLIIVAFAFGARRSKVARQQRWSTTWDCGFATSSPRIQYTASSFAQMIVWSFRAVLRPRIDEPKIVAVFAGSTEFESHVGDVVLDEVVTPGWRGFGSRLRPLRALQWGSVQQYIFYILVILILLLCVFVVPIMELLRSF